MAERQQKRQEQEQQKAKQRQEQEQQKPAKKRKSENDGDGEKPKKRRKRRTECKACGSKTHVTTRHLDCPFNKRNMCKQGVCNSATGPTAKPVNAFWDEYYQDDGAYDNLWNDGTVAGGPAVPTPTTTAAPTPTTVTAPTPTTTAAPTPTTVTAPTPTTVTAPTPTTVTAPKPTTVTAPKPTTATTPTPTATAPVTPPAAVPTGINGTPSPPAFAPRVNDNVYARWKPRQWYLAHVTHIYPNRQGPLYTVYFPGDGKVKKFLPPHHVRPVDIKVCGPLLRRSEMIGREFEDDGDEDLPAGRWLVRAMKANVYTCCRLTGGGLVNLEDFDIGYVMRRIKKSIEESRERGPRF